MGHWPAIFRPASSPHLPVDSPNRQPILIDRRRPPPRAAAWPPPRLSHLTSFSASLSMAARCNFLLSPASLPQRTAFVAPSLPSGLPSWWHHLQHNLEAQIELKAGKIE